eukprot:CAMPEP_0113495366 /NCGR_PEP_ID=MMETSP0014_2-20120614/29575_1 /TAXON_ID=2857 /ORGANISM="Nitzschia sp." /LENGTH=534 /DNA_ID=CAMNT_0000389267 /DNA_START=208 /DNA_END=1813 /DNA_ORIENTATION=- /assembly_acc=CAM_ASM_000159
MMKSQQQQSNGNGNGSTSTEYEAFPKEKQQHQQPNLPWLMEYWSSSLVKTPPMVSVESIGQLFSCGTSTKDVVFDEQTLRTKNNNSNNSNRKSSPSSKSKKTWKFDIDDETHQQQQQEHQRPVEATTNLERLRAMVASHGDESADLLGQQRADDGFDFEYDVNKTQNIWKQQHPRQQKRSTTHIPPIRRSSILDDDDDDESVDNEDEDVVMGGVEEEKQEHEEEEGVREQAPKTMTGENRAIIVELYDDQNPAGTTTVVDGDYGKDQQPPSNEPTAGWDCTRDEAMWLGGGQYLSRCDSFNTDMGFFDASRKFLDCSSDSGAADSNTQSPIGRRSLFTMMDDSTVSRRYRRSQAIQPPESPTPSEQTYTTVSITQSYIADYDNDVENDGEDDDAWFERLSHPIAATPSSEAATMLTPKPSPFRSDDDGEEEQQDPFATPVRPNNSGAESDVSSEKSDFCQQHEAYRYLIRMKPSNYRHRRDGSSIIDLMMADGTSKSGEDIFEDSRHKVEKMTTSMTKKHHGSRPPPPSLPMLP